MSFLCHLRVEGAGAARIDLGADHMVWRIRMVRIKLLVLEGVARETIAGDALVDLGDEVLTSAVTEHVLAASVARGLGAVWRLGSNGGNVGGWCREDNGGGSDGGDELEEQHFCCLLRWCLWRKRGRQEQRVSFWR